MNALLDRTDTTNKSAKSADLTGKDEQPPGQNKSGGSSRKCRACGQMVEKVYQQDMCKPCLVKSFKNIVKFIDNYRSGS